MATGIASTDRDDDERGDDERGAGHPIVNIDPDFSMPAGRDRSGSYLRAWRNLFPKAS